MKSRERVHLSKIFHMLSGTSIGGILTAGFSMPEEKGSLEPLYYSDNITDIGVEMASVTFNKTEEVKTFEGWLLWVLILIGILCGTAISYGQYRWKRDFCCRPIIISQKKLDKHLDQHEKEVDLKLRVSMKEHMEVVEKQKLAS